MALYHKHRPQDFSSLIGQEHVKQTITNQIIRGSVAHAYVFSGPRGVGKTTTARLLAKAVNCTERPKDQAEPCNQCDSCKQITEGRSIDVMEIDAASHTGVDHVREQIIEQARFQPMFSTHKVYIIDEVHMLSTSAFNALLKILEEPPAYVLFILATTEIHKLPETVVSRCQHFVFRRVPLELMLEELRSLAVREGVTVEETVLTRIAQKSEGCLRDALSLLDQLLASGQTTITEEDAELLLPEAKTEEAVRFVESLLLNNPKQAVMTLNQIQEAHIDLLNFSQEVIDVLRTVILAQIGATDAHTAYQKRLGAAAEACSSTDLIILLDLLLKRSGEIRSCAIPSLPLEMLVAEWCKVPQTLVRPPAMPERAAVPEQEIPQVKGEGEKKTSKTEVKTAAATSVRIEPADEKAIRTAWQTCSEEVAGAHPSLRFIIQAITVQRVSSEEIVLSVPFKLYVDKLNDPRQKEKFLSKLTVLLGTAPTLIVEVDESAEEARDKAIETLAAAIGGDVVGGVS